MAFSYYQKRVKHTLNHDRNNVIYWSIFLFAFLLMSRKSNLVPVSSRRFDKSRQLCRGDVQEFPNYLLVHFRWTKTIQFGNRTLIIPLLAMPSSNFCPVRAYHNMCNLNPGSPTSPAFVVNVNGNTCALNYVQFQRKLKSLIHEIGLDPNLFSSHSFRRGELLLLIKLAFHQILFKLWVTGKVMHTKNT